MSETTDGMRILVSFKVTPDYEALPEESWAAPAAPETRYVRRILNCFDESALELALRLRDDLAGRGEAATLSALTLGGRDTEPYCKTLLALGYERVTRVAVEDEEGDGAGEGGAEGPGATAAEPGAALDFAPDLTAALIADFVREVDYADLLLLGHRSGPGDSGLVPFLVAEALGWPCLADLVELDPLGDGRLRVTCAAQGGLRRATVRTPCVLAIGNAVVSHLRVPTLKDRLALGERGGAMLTPQRLGVDVGAGAQRRSAVLVGLEPLDRSRAGVVLGGDSPRAKAQALFDDYLKPRLVRPPAEAGDR